MTLACIKSPSIQGQPTLSPQLRSWGRGRDTAWPSLYLQGRNQRLSGNQSRNQRLSGNQSSAWRDSWSPDTSGLGQPGCSGWHWGEGQPRENSSCSLACSLQSKGLSRVFSNTTVESINSSVLSFPYSPTLAIIQNYWKKL